MNPIPRPDRRLPRICALVALGAVTLLSGAFAGPRLDQIQVLGTHNSYHVAPHPSLDALIRSRSPDLADSVAYTHRPLPEQLDRLGIRQIELDLYADPEGGRFAEPLGIPAAASRNLPAPPAPDTDPLRTPGAKILHVPDFDYLTTVSRFRDALRELEEWSAGHPHHLPVFVLLELKQEAAGPEFTAPVPWSAALLDSLEQEIRDVLPPSRLLRPDDIRGTHKSLRDAVAGRGWPDIAAARGRFVFLLDNTDAVRDLLLARSSVLAGRILFPSVEETHPAAAWFKINDPLADGDRIRRLVRAGFLVRTRADADTLDARRGDVRRRDAAWASGAQLISTDYPEPHRSFGPYQVAWPGGVVARPNPVSLPAAPGGTDLETLAPRGFEPFAPAELAHLNRRAMRFHEQRRLQEASRDYTRLLELEPVQPPTPEQARRIDRLRPRLRLVGTEPFALRDVVALHHPVQPWIAYHLFWGDDIDFPEDNDPADHEIVWVAYDPATDRPTQIHTYFHGEIVAAPPPADGDRPVVAVEWGKHGSLPLDGDRPVREPANLRRHWQRLHDSGIRLPSHPLARDWPKAFEGEWEDYVRFSRELDPGDLLNHPARALVTPWANAALDQHALPYNFAAKPEWPPAGE